MSYTLDYLLVRDQMTLTQQSDLTVAVTSLVDTTTYLVVTSPTGLTSVIDINASLVYTRGLDLTQSVSAVFGPLITDAFVAAYGVTNIPTPAVNGAYDRRVVVTNPLSTTKTSVSYTSIKMPDAVDDIALRGYLNDLVVSTNDEEDLSNSLFAVNGVFHKTILFNSKMYVIDGFRNFRVANRTDMLRVDTGYVGGHTIVPITADNLTFTQYNGPAFVAGPSDSAFVGKTVFLVIDGYLYHPGSVFQMWGGSTLRIDTSMIDFVSQFRNNPRTMYTKDVFGFDPAEQGTSVLSDKYIDVFVNNTMVPMSTFTTQDFQLSRLTNQHSFLVVVNNDTLLRTVTEVCPTGTPQFYMDQADRPLTGITQYGCGLSPSYVSMIDAYGGHRMFLPKQNQDLDIQKFSISPPGVPYLIPEPNKAANLPLRFYDYFSA